MDQTQPQPQPIYQSPKSSVAAGLLGIFLGGIGAHSWYLGDKKRGTIHLCLFGGGFVLTILASILTTVAVSTGAGFLVAIFGLLMVIAYIAMLGNSIWSLVEAIIILAQGDAGLAAKGYVVAQPYVAAAPVAQPAQPAPAAPAAPATSTTPTAAPAPAPAAEAPKAEAPKAEPSKAEEKPEEKPETKPEEPKSEEKSE